MLWRKSKTKNGKNEDAQTPESTEEGLLEHALLVVDGSEPSIEAARFAVRLSAQLGTRITAVYVVDTATMDYLLRTHIFVAEEREEFERDLENTGRRYLEYVTTIGKNHGVAVKTILEQGAMHQTILHMARDLNVDAIMVGGWRRSITQKDAASVERQLILDQAYCPVIVVKTPQNHGNRA